MKKLIWSIWILITLSISGYLGYEMFAAEDKSDFLIGEATHGHFQIEMACTTCHTDAFGGEEVLQNACTSCHEEELKAGHDSHPKKKFTDPRNADRLEILDARYCITCHTEHQAEQTHAMGVTIPDDYCYHCHQEIADERDSHKDLAFDSCATSGCHNYHDNRALYERFLVENAEGPWLKAMASITGESAAKLTSPHAMSKIKMDKMVASSAPPGHWDDNFHFEKGVSCQSCHSDTLGGDQWNSKPGVESCQTCHGKETEGYLSGKHGMRLAQNLSPVTPEQSSLVFNPEHHNTEHSCTTCHKSGEFNSSFASVEACLGCHADDHSLAFSSSPHGELAQKVKNGELPEEQGVTCATCHLPKLETTFQGQKALTVQHNQNDNLRPNEKMIRPVCMSCHSLAFSIDALADEQLIERNFNGQPAKHVPSIDWAVEREK